jgi:tRNA A37 N6-isopentenylltransferase MiaA
MKGLNVTKTISLDLSAEVWDLYTATNPAACNQAAQKMNEAIEDAYNMGYRRDELMEKVMLTFRRYAKLGSLDTEPLNKLEEVLDKLYGHP